MNIRQAHRPLAKTPAFAAFAFRAARFLVGGVLVYFIAASVGHLTDKALPGSSAYVVPVLVWIYSAAAIANLTVAALTWPQSEDELSLRLILPMETENHGDPREPGPFWRKYRAGILLSPSIAVLEVRGRALGRVVLVDLEFVDGAQWRVRPVYRAVGAYEGEPIRVEIGTNMLSDQSLRHGQIVRGTIRDVDGGERRAAVRLERSPVDPPPMLVKHLRSFSARKYGIPFHVEYP